MTEKESIREALLLRYGSNKIRLLWRMLHVLHGLEAQEDGVEGKDANFAKERRPGAAPPPTPHKAARAGSLV